MYVAAVVLRVLSSAGLIYTLLHYLYMDYQFLITSIVQYTTVYSQQEIDILSSHVALL